MPITQYGRAPTPMEKEINLEYLISTNLELLNIESEINFEISRSTRYIYLGTKKLKSLIST